jgi:2-polyprenyl-3-methyl-5-hydroxy-6-metoxy-1,4-benzoquinol methylase
MRPEILEILLCPGTGERLRVEDAVMVGGCMRSGWLVSADGQHRYPIKNFIPRFVPESNYANNFGMQWNKFRQTQLDSYSGHSISAERFWKATGWRPEDIAGKWVLDIGCGAGRFAEVALKAGAKVVALDYSNAVDACYENLKQYQDLHVVKGDIYALPFIQSFFPFVYSLGVLQHTPDVARAFFALILMVSSGGSICVDFYEKNFKSIFLPKFWLRPITKRIPQEKLFIILESLVPELLPLSRLFAKVPILGRGLKRLVPVANYEGILPLNEKQLFEWSLLDTFDWFAPQFDNPQTKETVECWLEKAGLEQRQVLMASHLVGRGRVPKVKKT